MNIQQSNSVFSFSKPNLRNAQSSRFQHAPSPHFAGNASQDKKSGFGLFNILGVLLGRGEKKATRESEILPQRARIVSREEAKAMRAKVIQQNLQEIETKHQQQTQDYGLPTFPPFSQEEAKTLSTLTGQSHAYLSPEEVVAEVQLALNDFRYLRNTDPWWLPQQERAEYCKELLSTQIKLAGQLREQIQQKDLNGIIETVIEIRTKHQHRLEFDETLLRVVPGLRRAVVKTFFSDIQAQLELKNPLTVGNLVEAANNENFLFCYKPETGAYQRSSHYEHDVYRLVTDFTSINTDYTVAEKKLLAQFNEDSGLQETTFALSMPKDEWTQEQPITREDALKLAWVYAKHKFRAPGMNER